MCAGSARILAASFDAFNSIRRILSRNSKNPASASASPSVSSSTLISVEAHIFTLGSADVIF
jgi:hypothetical protein